MEDDDEIVLNDDGILELSFRGWETVSPSIYPYSRSIIHLDLSFNCLVELPDEIGTLCNLQSINVSCNKLQSIPHSIGRLRRLTSLKAEGNKLNNLPEELGSCISLKSIHLAENQINNLPESLGNCISLAMLDLQNNNLNSLPLTLSKIDTKDLKIDCSHNPNLKMIPEEMKSDSETIRWIIMFLYEKKKIIDIIEQTTIEMSQVAKSNEHTISEYNAEIEKLRTEKDFLLEERESVRCFIKFREWTRSCNRSFKMYMAFCEKMFSRSSKPPMEYYK
jgi:Leucine-rich repeat (LRR) protein